MSKETAVIALGIWAILLPYLGVPRAWLTILLVLTGLGLVILGFLLRAEILSRGVRRHTHNHFVEHVPHGGESAPEVSHERKERINSLN